MQADGEPAQRTCAQAVVDEVCRPSAIGIAPARAPAYDHQASGGAEKAIRGLKDQVRVMLATLARHIGAVNVTEPIFE